MAVICRVTKLCTQVYGEIRKLCFKFYTKIRNFAVLAIHLLICYVLLNISANTSNIIIIFTRPCSWIKYLQIMCSYMFITLIVPKLQPLIHSARVTLVTLVSNVLVTLCMLILQSCVRALVK